MEAGERPANRCSMMVLPTAVTASTSPVLRPARPHRAHTAWETCSRMALVIRARPSGAVLAYWMREITSAPKTRWRFMPPSVPSSAPVVRS